MRIHKTLSGWNLNIFKSQTVKLKKIDKFFTKRYLLRIKHSDTKGFLTGSVLT